MSQSLGRDLVNCLKQTEFPEDMDDVRNDLNNLFDKADNMVKLNDEKIAGYDSLTNKIKEEGTELFYPKMYLGNESFSEKLCIIPENDEEYEQATNSSGLKKVKVLKDKNGTSVLLGSDDEYEIYQYDKNDRLSSTLEVNEVHYSKRGKEGELLHSSAKFSPDSFTIKMYEDDSEFFYDYEKDGHKRIVDEQLGEYSQFGTQNGSYKHNKNLYLYWPDKQYLGYTGKRLRY